LDIKSSQAAVATQHRDPKLSWPRKKCTHQWAILMFINY